MRILSEKGELVVPSKHLCIYCPTPDPDSPEHSLPQGLGPFKNHTTLNNTICTSCNNRLGKLDEQFCRVGPTGFFRFVAGIGKAENLYHRSHKIDPVELRGKLDGESNDVLWEIVPGSRDARKMRQIVFQCGDQVVPIPIDKKMKTPEDLAQALEARNITTGVPKQMICLKGEEEWLKSLVQPLLKSDALQWETQQSRQKSIKIEARTQHTEDYYREIAKIAFHHALEAVTFLRGNEVEFSGIRDYIMGLRNDRGSFVKKRGPFDYWQALGFVPSKWCHYLLVNVNPLQINVLCQFFVGPEFLSPCYAVSIGPNPLRIMIRPIQIAHQFSYYDRRSPEGFVGEVHKSDDIINVRE